MGPKEKLRLMQIFSQYPPMCDRRGCTQRAQGFYCASDGRGRALCMAHILKAAKLGVVDLKEHAHYQPEICFFDFLSEQVDRWLHEYMTNSFVSVRVAGGTTKVPQYLEYECACGKRGRVVRESMYHRLPLNRCEECGQEYELRTVLSESQWAALEGLEQQPAS